jgi:hypothetical protein
MGALIVTKHFLLIVADCKEPIAPIGLADSVPESANPIKLRRHDQNVEQ